MDLHKHIPYNGYFLHAANFYEFYKSVKIKHVNFHRSKKTSHENFYMVRMKVMFMTFSSALTTVHVHVGIFERF